MPHHGLNDSEAARVESVLRIGRSFMGMYSSAGHFCFIIVSLNFVFFFFLNMWDF